VESEIEEIEGVRNATCHEGARRHATVPKDVKEACVNEQMLKQRPGALVVKLYANFHFSVHFSVYLFIYSLPSLPSLLPSLSLPLPLPLPLSLLFPPPLLQLYSHIKKITVFRNCTNRTSLSRKSEMCRAEGIRFSLFIFAFLFRFSLFIFYFIFAFLFRFSLFISSWQK
jgi:hypothetical protein